MNQPVRKLAALNDSALGYYIYTYTVKYISGIFCYPYEKQTVSEQVAKYAFFPE
jgi:hypothetical protein